MAQIQPFKAIRYNTRDVSNVIAPPYDILTLADKLALLARDDHNIVAIDLPHVPPKTAGPDEVYAQAAGDLTCWLDIRCLVHDQRPALYAYHQVYKLGSRTLTRKKFFARLKLEEFGKGAIYPHEQTFGGPKEDRLKLTAATRCNLSPIFGLYPDPQNEITAILDAETNRPPDQWGTLDGVESRLWVIDSAPVIKSIQVRLADRPVFIADGHHRYGTALMFRQRQVEATGEPMESDPVNFVLAVLGSMEDPGATIQPYFRTIVEPAGLSAPRLGDALADAFHFTPVPRPRTADDLAAALTRAAPLNTEPRAVPGVAGESASKKDSVSGTCNPSAPSPREPDRAGPVSSAASPSSFMLYFAKDNICAILTPKKDDLLAEFEPGRHPAWRRLSYTLLHEYVVKRVIEPKLAPAGVPATLHYHKTMEEALADAEESGGVACLMPATTMQQLRDICTAGELMPQKSTYFFPKLATGMVINPLY